MKTLLIYLLLFSFSITRANVIEEFFTYIKNSKYSLAYQIALTKADKQVQQELIKYYNIILNNSVANKKPSSLVYKKDSPEEILHLINTGLTLFLINENEVKAISTLNDAYTIAIKTNNKILATESIKLILEIYQRFNTITEDNSYKSILKNYSFLLHDEFEKKNYILKTLKLNHIFHRENTETVQELINKYKTQLNSKNVNSIFQNAKINLLLSNIDLKYKKNPNDAKKLILTSIKDIGSIEQGVFEKERLIAAKINLAIIYFKEKNYTKTIEILSNIEIDDAQYILKLIKVFKLYWLYQAHKEKGNELVSLKYHNQYLELFALLNQTSKANENADLRTKYQTEQKDKQILIEQEQKKRFKNWVAILAVLIFLSSIIFYLTQKSTKRKQLLAEQEKELQKQKVATLLKEQELTTIDAIISGQEKERQRIANDLHDDLGGLMATIKLHFNALKEKQTKELLTKTNTLLDKAYEKIRSIAHTKNSGVMAKKGLLKAVKEMAKTVTQSNKLIIDVLDYGLDNRLENSLELTIFRIIQELITNVIKHANATEATIYITNHNNSLNIMVEDNGIGFNTNQISKQKGMGIHSIDKRVENLEGTVTIESEINKGTTVIIDIPL